MLVNCAIKEGRQPQEKSGSPTPTSCFSNLSTDLSHVCGLNSFLDAHYFARGADFILDTFQRGGCGSGRLLCGCKKSPNVWTFAKKKIRYQIFSLTKDASIILK